MVDVEVKATNLEIPHSLKAALSGQDEGEFPNQVEVRRDLIGWPGLLSLVSRQTSGFIWFLGCF